MRHRSSSALDNNHDCININTDVVYAAIEADGRTIIASQVRQLKTVASQVCTHNDRETILGKGERRHP